MTHNHTPQKKKGKGNGSVNKLLTVGLNYNDREDLPAFADNARWSLRFNQAYELAPFHVHGPSAKQFVLRQPSDWHSCETVLLFRELHYCEGLDHPVCRSSSLKGVNVC